MGKKHSLSDKTLNGPFWPLFALSIICVIILGSFSLDSATSAIPSGSNETAIEVLPILLDGYVNPWCGSPRDTYTFSIVWKDSNGEAPEFLRVVVNGTPISLEPFPGLNAGYSAGVPFITKTQFPIGTYSYFFEAKNKDGVIRFPESEEGCFKVIHLDAYLANATVSPLVGMPGDTYTFTVTYVGPHRPWGTGVRLHVFSYRTPFYGETVPPPPLIFNRIPQTDPTERNYSIGVEFRMSITLKSGRWWYYYAGNSTFHYPFFRRTKNSLERGALEEFFPGPWVLINETHSSMFSKKNESGTIGGFGLPVFFLGLVIILNEHKKRKKNFLRNKSN